MSRNESEITTIIPSIPSAIAPSPSERKKQFSIALEEENWPQALSAAFPDVISQTDLTAQVEILNEISAANRRCKRWNRVRNIGFIGGMTGVILGTLGGRAELTAGGFILITAFVIPITCKGESEERRIKANIERWENLQTGWWLRENR